MRSGDATGTSAPSETSDGGDETATSDVALAAGLSRKTGKAPQWGESQSSRKVAQNSWKFASFLPAEQYCQGHCCMSRKSTVHWWAYGSYPQRQSILPIK